MDIDQSAVFFVGSILTCLGFSVVAVTVLFLNNLFSKYWKPIEWRIIKEWDYRYAYQQEPVVKDKKDDKPTIKTGN